MLYRSGSMRVGVTVWFGWGGVVSTFSGADHPSDSNFGPVPFTDN